MQATNNQFSDKFNNGCKNSRLIAADGLLYFYIALS